MAEPSPSYRDLIGLPDMPALLGAIALLRLGGSMLALTLILYALSRFSSPELAGWVAFAAVAPGLMISPLAGAVLDRIGCRMAVIIDMTVGAALMVCLMAADKLGWASPPVLLTLVSLLSLTRPLSAAGVRVLLPRLVTPAAYDRVNALDTAVFAIVEVIGPALAGLMVALAGARSALGCIALLFGSAALCIARIPGRPSLYPSRRSLLHDMLEGVAIVAREPTLRGLALSYSLYQVSWGILVIVVPVVVTRHFGDGTGKSMAGFIWAAMGLAGGAGALVAGRLRTAGRERHVMALGMILAAVAAWPIAAECGLGGLVIGLMLAGFVAGPIDVALLTLRQRSTDPAQLGRVLAVSISLNMAGLPLGSALAGTLIPHSLKASFGVAGLSSLVAAMAVRHRRSSKLVKTDSAQSPAEHGNHLHRPHPPAQHPAQRHPARAEEDQEGEPEPGIPQGRRQQAPGEQKDGQR
jgi:predicted MFS family arabinose efflux permease